jgi:hypothetical protein
LALAAYLRRAPDTATVEDPRNFQLHLVDRGTSPIGLNATITALKFFFDVMLDRAEFAGSNRIGLIRLGRVHGDALGLQRRQCLL